MQGTLIKAQGFLIRFLHYDVFDDSHGADLSICTFQAFLMTLGSFGGKDHLTTVM